MWSWDFISDRTDNGGKLRILSVIDEYSRECLALHVARKLTAADLIEVMKSWLPSEGYPLTSAAITAASSSPAPCKAGWLIAR